MWSFATSRVGLALSSEEFWALTPREYDALRARWEWDLDERRSHYAGIQVTLHNAWFRGDSHPQAWTPEEFVGIRGRPPKAQKLTPEQEQQHAWAVAETQKLQMQMRMMQVSNTGSGEMKPEMRDAFREYIRAEKSC